MQYRTDLAMESKTLSKYTEGIRCTTLRHGGIEETRIKIETPEAGNALQKEPGTYVTFTDPNMARCGAEERKQMARLLSEAVRGMLPPKGDLLIVGLGNRYMTADALGSKTVEHLLITRQMKKMNGDALGERFRSVCALEPGVLGVTGMETAEVVKGIVQQVKPAAVIAIDALAARETSRIGTVIQVTDTGIQPGSGVGNHRSGLNRKTLSVPVIALGVPMVVYAGVIARDALGMLLRDLGMPEDEHAQAMDALADKVTRQGLGELVVTPREVDEMVGRLARILGDALNMAAQARLTEEEIQFFSHDSMA